MKGTEPQDERRLGLSISTWRTASCQRGTSTFPVRWVTDELLFCLGHCILWGQFVTAAWSSLIKQSLTHGRCHVKVSSFPMSYSYAQLPSLLHLWCVQPCPGLFAFTMSFLTTVLPDRYYHLHFTDAESTTLRGEVMHSGWPSYARFHEAVELHHELGQSNSTPGLFLVSHTVFMSWHWGQMEYDGRKIPHGSEYSARCF